MKNADMPAMPVPLNPGEKGPGDYPPDGLTKREEMAARMTAAVLSSGDIAFTNLLDHEEARDRFADGMASLADALLDALERR